MTQHVFEQAASGRSKCRSCGKQITKDTLRFGEKLPNPFGDSDMTHWHHPACAANRRPEPLTEALTETDYAGDNKHDLLTTARHTGEFHRLQRLGQAEQASSGRARCRACNELIAKDTWRLPLIFFQDDAYNSSGFIHAGCVGEYCETTEVWPTVAQFALEISDADLGLLRQALT